MNCAPYPCFHCEASATLDRMVPILRKLHGTSAGTRIIRDLSVIMADVVSSYIETVPTANVEVLRAFVHESFDRELAQALLALRRRVEGTRH